MVETILVTGGSGFLGAHLANKLVKLGHRVIVFDLGLPKSGGEIDWLLTTNNTKNSIEFVKGNIIDISAILQTVKEKKVTKIVHAAVINDLTTLEMYPLYTLKVNVEGTLNILEAVRLFGVEKIVLTSSISVYAPMQYEPIDERHPVLLPDEGPTLFSYSSSKLSAEAFGMHYWSTYGIDFLALRFSAIYGLGMQYPMFVKPMVENSVLGKDTYFDSGENSARDYTYVDDVIQGIELALKRETKNRIFNIATGDVLQTASEAAKIVMELQPSVNINFGEGSDLVEERTVKTRGRLSIESARQELGFAPRYTLKQGVTDFFQRFTEFNKI